jgi:hypothetical protein
MSLFGSGWYKIPFFDKTLPTSIPGNYLCCSIYQSGGQPYYNPYGNNGGYDNGYNNGGYNNQPYYNPYNS